MLGYLKGKILLKGDDFLMVEVNGVGYKVFVSKQRLKKTKENSTAELFVWPHLKRETIELYGCLSQEEFALFELLEKMPGIGPKTALALASIGSLEKLKKALEQKDNKLLASVRGLGHKRRQRLILELTGQLKDLEKETSWEKDEAFVGLLSLGFSKNTAKMALAKVPQEIKNTEKRIQKALRILGKG